MPIAISILVLRNVFGHVFSNKFKTCLARSFTNKNKVGGIGAVTLRAKAITNVHKIWYWVFITMFCRAFETAKIYFDNFEACFFTSCWHLDQLK